VVVLKRESKEGKRRLFMLSKSLKRHFLFLQRKTRSLSPKRGALTKSANRRESSVRRKKCKRRR